MLRIVSNGRISDEDLCLPRALNRSALISPIKAKAKFIKGDKVRLEWDHNYVTRSEENGGESKYPERVITMIEPVA